MENEFVLFQNKVYSLKSTYDPFWGIDYMSIYKHGFFTDEELYPRLLDEKGQPFPPQLTGYPGALFQYNDAETRCRKNILERKKKQEINLDFARQVIVDDRYPVYIYYQRPFKRITASRRMALTIGEYQISFGRKLLVEMIGSHRYRAAMPELREIIIHDTSRTMKLAAWFAIKQMADASLAPMIKEILENHKLGLYLTSSFIELIGNRLALPMFIPVLEKLFEEYYYYIPDDIAEMNWAFYRDSLMQQIITLAVANIPSLASLPLLQKALNHPFAQVERTAHRALKQWAKNTARHSIQTNDNQLIKRVLDTIYIFDLTDNKSLYDVLKKDSFDFRTFQMLECAHFIKAKKSRKK